MSTGVSLGLERVAKTFADGTQALKPTDLAVARGETVVFLGPSGCGKTTCLRIIAGLEKPDPGGRVLFDDEDVTGIEIERREIGMVFQSYALFPHMTVAENIAYGLKVRKVPAADKARRVREMLALCGIEALADRRIDQISGGQRQRVALARAVAIRPRILLLDEPLTALDAALRERLRGELDQLLRSLGITTVYVTHDQAEAMGLADRIVVMRQGEIVQVGAPRDVYSEPASRFVAEFIGAANVIEADLTAGAFRLPGGTLPAPVHLHAGRHLVMLRPETIGIEPHLDTGDGHGLSGVIDTVQFLGDRQRLTVSGAAATPLMVEVPGTMACRRGDRIALRVPPHAVRLLPG